VGIAGTTASGRGGRFALARYRANGALDTAFSGDGKVTTDFTAGPDGANDLAIQGDGKIVVAGSAEPVLYEESTFALARYRSDGTLDTSVGGEGKVRTKLGYFSGANGVAIQTDDRIVTAGDAGGQFGLARYESDGELDASFGSKGKITTAFGGWDFCNDVAIQPDGRIVAVGSVELVYDAEWAFALARYLAG